MKTDSRAQTIFKFKRCPMNQTTVPDAMMKLRWAQMVTAAPAGLTVSDVKTFPQFHMIQTK